MEPSCFDCFQHNVTHKFKNNFSYTVIPVEAAYSISPFDAAEVAQEPDMDAPKYKTFHPDLPRNQILSDSDAQNNQQRIKDLLSTVDPVF